jgi:glycosyltransferase involved in cell wall biosynthesis
MKLFRITTISPSFAILLCGQLRFMQQYYDVTAISSDKEHLQKIGETEGVKIYPVELTRQITLFKDLKALYKLYIYFWKEKPAIVHTHTPKAGLIGMLAACFTKVPFRLHTVAGLPLMEASGMKRTILNFTEKLTYRCATRVYPNSKGLYEFILQHEFCQKNKLKIIGTGSSNGIDTVHFSPIHFLPKEKADLRTNLNIRSNDFVFCFVGRLVKDKGINELIQSFIKINQQYLYTKLLLVGPFERKLDPLLPATEKEIQNNPNIISVGYQSDVRPYFSISDALVFPSYREGFPNVVMQAGAMGLPSIVTDINGCNEIIAEDINGTIIPVKNALALQQKMEDYLIDKDLLSRHKASAREMITSRYEQKIVWQAILNEYKSLEEKHV